jgi:hypothetical protein
MTRAICVCVAIAFSSTTALAAGPTANTCVGVLTADVAQHVLGGAVAPGIRNAVSDQTMGTTMISRCSYSLKGVARGAAVSLMLTKAGSADEAKSNFTSSKATYKGQDVPGLGDAAYRTAMPAQLNVLKGRDWLIIAAGPFPAGDPMLQQKAAMEILRNLHD